MVDDVTRECLAAIPDTSILGRRVVRELKELVAVHGKPGMIVNDRHRVDFEDGTRILPRGRDRMELHHAEQADSECVRREI